jgi:hypothetical protein
LSHQETVNAGINPLNWADSLSGRRNPARRKRWGRVMSVVIFIVLTVAIFAVLGLVQKLVENL